MKSRLHAKATEEYDPKIQIESINHDSKVADENDEIQESAHRKVRNDHLMVSNSMDDRQSIYSEGPNSYIEPEYITNRGDMDETAGNDNIGIDEFIIQGDDEM